VRSCTVSDAPKEEEELSSLYLVVEAPETSERNGGGFITFELPVHADMIAMNPAPSKEM